MSTDDSRAPARGPAPDHQRAVDDLFDSSAPYWRDIYGSDDFQSRVYRRRRDRALAWTKDLVASQRDQRALDVGCGAGLSAIGLARQGYLVDAVDASHVMVDEATQAVEHEHLADRVTLRTADAHQLPWDDESFSLVVALGVVPWLHSPEVGLAEMARVTRRGGHVLVSADNLLGLSNLLEPRLSAAIAPIRHGLGAVLRALRLRGPQGLSEHRYRPRTVDRMLSGAGLEKVRAASIGFGRFTIFGARVISERRSCSVDDRLQQLADRHRPIVRSMGNHYLVLTQRR